MHCLFTDAVVFFARTSVRVKKTSLGKKTQRKWDQKTTARNEKYPFCHVYFMLKAPPAVKTVHFSRLNIWVDFVE